MTADADRLDLAAEYVLGTLDADEREEVEALIRSDATFAALVRQWENKLGELSAMVEPVNPPPELWMAIQGRLAEITPTAAVRLPEFLERPVVAPDTAASAAAPEASAGFAGPAEAQDGAPEAAEPEAAEPEAAEPEAVAPEATAPNGERETATGTAAATAMGETDGADGAAAEREAGERTNVVDLTRRLQRWRGGAAVLGALAAAFAAIIVTAALAPDYLPAPLRPQPELRTVEVPRDVVRTVEVPAPAPGRFVAVLQSSATAPAFILTVDVAQRNLTIRRVAAEAQADHSYELWLVSDRFQQPRSLGLIGIGEFTRAPTLAAYDPDTISAATFAVSLEPEGGSPTGLPTGPVLFSGKLVEAVPPTRTP